MVHLVTRNRRRYGGYVVHLGVVMIVLGVVGSSFYQQETQAALRSGESLHLGRYTLTYDSLRQYALEEGDLHEAEHELETMLAEAEGTELTAVQLHIVLSWLRCRTRPMTTRLDTWRILSAWPQGMK